MGQFFWVLGLSFLGFVVPQVYAQSSTLPSAPNRAGLITPSDKNDNEDILMLVMPVMLSNYA